RKRVNDILKRAAQSVAVQRARDDLCFTPQLTDKLDYISTNDDIDEKEKNTFIQQVLSSQLTIAFLKSFFLFQQQQPSNTPTLSGKQPDTSTSPLTVFIDHSQSNDLLLYSSSSPLNLPFTPDQNDSTDDEPPPLDNLATDAMDFTIFLFLRPLFFL
ncbi:unnamed protein product, partial [Didymodactylos carnosus]